MSEEAADRRAGNLSDTGWWLVSERIRPGWRGSIPPPRHVFVALLLAIGFVSSAQGQAGAARARTGAAKVIVATRGDQVESSGPSTSGYWLVASDGGIYAFGDAHFHGSTAGVKLANPIVGIAATADGKGYWLASSDGGIFAFGDVHFLGSTGGVKLANPIVGIAATPDGRGYWLVASDGGIYAFGDAHFHGSTAGVKLANPIAGIAATADGKGYWLASSDGGIFAFGDAHFLGSTGGVKLANPIVGIAATPDGKGYWLVASDGGIYAFGDAHFHGSTAGVKLANPIVGIAATADGKGYWLASSDGGIFAFGDAHFLGSTGGVKLANPIVGIAATGADGGLVSLDDIDGHHKLADLSCPTNGWCMAVDRAGHAINYSGGAWHTPVRVDPGSIRHADLGHGEFDAVSCPTTTFCMAVSNLDGYTTYNGVRWSTIQWPPSEIGNGFHAVSCASPTFCEAEVDNFGHQAQWEHGTWSETSEDQSLHTQIGQGPSSVSCALSATAQYCVYVDNYNRYSVYDNGTWVDRGSKLFATTYVQAEVSCYAVHRCGAINDNGDAITYDGSSWSASTLVDSLGQLAGAPADLSCLTGFCGAGDFGGNVLYDNASSWSAPLAVDNGHITAISCASSTFCVAVDLSGHAFVLDPETA